MLGKAMKMAGVRRITPEMAREFSVMEKIAAGMGGFLSLRGALFALVSFVGFYPFGKKAVDAFRPSTVVTDLNEVAELGREMPVDVFINVDFEEGVKVWKVKHRYFVTPVKGYEGKVFFYRRNSHLEGEGKDKPIRVKGWAGKKEGLLGWDVPGLDSSADERFASAGMKVPDDAEILYEADEQGSSTKEGVIFGVLSLGMAFIMWMSINRVIRTVRILGDSAMLARTLNEHFGFDDE